MKRGSLWRWHRLRGRLNIGATEPVVKFGWESCAYPSCPKMRTEPKSRILEVLSKFAETSRRGTGDPLFTEAVRGLLRDSGVKPLRLPANSPNLNVIVHYVFGYRCAQVSLTERYEAVETLSTYWRERIFPHMLTLAPSCRESDLGAFSTTTAVPRRWSPATVAPRRAQPA